MPFKAMIYQPTEENIKRAAGILRAGGVVAFPTETVYGLGADAGNSAAVRQIFEIKRRPAFNPLIVHIASPDQLGSVADLKSDERAAARAKKLLRFWPGPLSMVLPRQAGICKEVTAGLDTVAVRMPRHDTALQLLAAADLPIAAPSANLFTTVSPTTAAHVEESFAGKLEMIIDGGPCQVGVESTIVSLLHEQVEILRPGGITMEEMQEALGPGEKVVLHQKAAAAEGSGAIMAPGMLKVHYAPRTPLAFRGSIAKSDLPRRTGLISFRRPDADELEIQFEHIISLSDEGDLSKVAARLFSAIREMDSLGLELVLIDTCPETGLGLAIMDRLKRAAAGFSTAKAPLTNRTTR